MVVVEGTANDLIVFSINLLAVRILIKILSTCTDTLETQKINHHFLIDNKQTLLFMIRMLLDLY